MSSNIEPNRIPNAGKLKWKEEFVQRYSKLTDWEEFKRSSLIFLRKSIRINTLAIAINDCLARLNRKGWQAEQIPWCGEGFWISNPERRDAGNLWEHHLGYIYIQEAASMIPPIVLNPQPHEAILDMAASPGSKTTQIAQYMKNTGVLVANDYKSLRLAALGMNLQRTCTSNAIMTLMAGQQLKNLKFDRILLDAPCSGTGTISKSLKTIGMWNPLMVTRLSNQQKQLADTAWKLLKPGGTLVYSTCTLEPEEDEGVVDNILNTQSDAHLDKIEPSELPDLKRSPAVTEFEDTIYDKNIKNCLRLWPQDNYTEGFFVARIRKEMD